MSRPVTPSATVSTHKSQTPPTSPIGHVLTVFADHAIWDETSSQFVKPEDVNGYNKF